MADVLKDVAIIGGGLTGPTLALSLKKQGISSTIYELHERGYQTGGPIFLASNALRVLDSVGVYQSLAKKGYNFEWLQLWNNSRKFLGSMSTGNTELYGYPSLRLWRYKIREELLNECEKEGIKIVYGKGLIDIKEEESGEVVLRFDDGTEERASLVVGTDGPHSKTRKVIAPDTNPTYSGFFVIYGVMPRSIFNEHLNGSPQTLPEPSVILGKEGSFCTVSTQYDGEEVGFFGNFALDDRGRDEWAAMDMNKESLRELLVKQYCKGNWDKGVEILCRHTKAEDFISWPTLLTAELETWSSPSGRIILAGDSAHTMPPAAAQGAAMGFEDAQTLALVLGKFKAQSGDDSAKSPVLREGLKKWADHRKERIRAVLAFTNLAAKMRSPSPWWVVQFFKEIFISLLFKIKGAEGYRWLYSYDGTSEEVKKALL